MVVLLLRATASAMKQPNEYKAVNVLGIHGVSYLKEADAIPVTDVLCTKQHSRLQRAKTYIIRY